MTDRTNLDVAAAPRIPCEGSGGPSYGYCQMCGIHVAPDLDKVPAHMRLDILRMLDD